jgi:hypothetical protein
MATRENVCCQLAAAVLAFRSVTASKKNRKPWSMKWIVLAIILFIPVYTYLTLHFRQPGPAYAPYGDLRDRADVIRLLKAGYQRVTIDASRPAETPTEPGTTMPAPGGLPAELKKTLVETPLLPLEIESASAAPTAVSSIDYPIALSYTTADEKRQLSGGHLYVREGELVIVADFERLGGALMARSRDGTALLDIPPGSLKPGSYHVTLVGEQSSRTWTLRVR